MKGHGTLREHIHLVGGPHDGEILNLDLKDEDVYPELIIIPTGKDDGELYEIAEEDYSCGAPKYLYAGYDWEPVGDSVSRSEDWEEDE